MMYSEYIFYVLQMQFVHRLLLVHCVIWCFIHYC